MFSGLTNQVSSWMGAVKGENGDEIDPNAEPQATTTQNETAGEATEQSFENVPVGEDGEKVTRCVLCLFILFNLFFFHFLSFLNQK